MVLTNTTNDKIRYVAFKLFLENGYEATNIRDICNKVDIKASSLYFYYESKQELFFSIYDEIWSGKIKYYESIRELKENIPPDLKLFALFKGTMEYCSRDIVKEKFLLRYHLFPPGELISILRDKYKFWTEKEYGIVAGIVKECLDKNMLDKARDLDDYLREYIKFTNFQLLEMIISNIKLSDREIYNLWLRFWNCNLQNYMPYKTFMSYKLQNLA